MKIDTTNRSLSLDPRDPVFFNDPYPIYRRLRESVPVFKWEQYGYWCFARHDDVAALLRDRRFGRQILHVMTREELGWPEIPRRLKPFYDFERHSLLETEPPVHTRLRGLVNRAFLSRTVERLRPRITLLAHELIDHFADKREVELLEAFATPIPITIIAELLGVPVETGPQLLAWSHDMVAMYQARRDTQVERKAVAATLAFSDFMRRYVKERRAAPGDDLLSQLIAAEAEGRSLSEDELITTAILLLNAGHEASVHAIGNGVKALVETGQAGPGFSEGHAEELLRFDAPLHLFTRYALEDVEYNGLRLKKGETVGLLLGAANRDPVRFPEPDRFDPSRAPNPHVSFGAGIHFCVGAPLARLELNVALPILFERLPGLKLARPPRYRDAYHFHGLERLDLAW
ncbi:cytochrome P450 [Nordella sp. HKS 07]|uniref:cytochrome P450 n=1 Tax=Nordella sp. HKS 07 TaxID=2712222 RepID=UPI0013E11975|nr:cytochrome P450 [Nordella sp. HKS 07]QIG46461.1 cytochrome P450 [Nordella sp. HKS 07]